MPPVGCHQPVNVFHNVMDKVVRTEIEWKWWDAGLLCRVVIEAEPNLNGKFVLRFVSTGGSGNPVTYYLQPDD